MGVGAAIRSLPREYNDTSVNANVDLSNPSLTLPGVSNLAVYCPGCLVVSGADYVTHPSLAQYILDQAADRLTQWPLIILADDVAIANNQTAFLWTIFTRFNPAADIYARAKLNRHHLGYELPLIIDARMKPGYPDELFPREDIVELVDRRWAEYFQK